MSRPAEFSFVESSMRFVSVVALAAMVGITTLQGSRAIEFVSTVRARHHFQAIRGQLSAATERQVEHLLETESFATNAAELEVVPEGGVILSMTADDRGWTAVASHPALGADRACAVFLGEPTAALPILPAAPGEVACTQ